MFNEERIIFIKDQVNSKTELFEIISKKAVELGISDDSNALVKGFEEREAQGSTGFQEGFGIPHCKTEKVNTPSAIFVRAEKPIEWDTFDKKPLTDMFALLIPVDNADEHLKILTTISRKLMNKDFRNEIKESKTPEEIIKVLSEIQ